MVLTLRTSALVAINSSRCIRRDHKFFAAPHTDFGAGSPFWQMAMPNPGGFGAASAAAIERFSYRPSFELRSTYDADHTSKTLFKQVVGSVATMLFEFQIARLVIAGIIIDVMHVITFWNRSTMCFPNFAV